MSQQCQRTQSNQSTCQVRFTSTQAHTARDNPSHRSSESQSFRLHQGEVPALPRPLTEYLRSLSLEIPKLPAPRRPIEPGPPGPERASIHVGPSEQRGTEAKGSSSLNRIKIPFICDENSPFLRRRFYVVVSGKVVGVFVDREFAVKVQSSELARYKFKTLLDALEFYNKKKAEGSLRIMRRSRDDEAIYGPLDEAIM